MINKKIKNNKDSRFIKLYSKGFTLVETMVAIFILTISITTFMSIVANGLFTSRYARDEITAGYLMQEAVDYIRNDRDTNILLGTTTWANFLTRYSTCTGNGCYIEVSDDTGPRACPQNCSMYYNENATSGPYYSYSGSTRSKFTRKIIVTNPMADEMDIEVTVSWKRGSKDITKSLNTTLMKW
jgi:prepilin-type N-terminal cleavage/methylation domain-containing protein